MKKVEDGGGSRMGRSDDGRIEDRARIDDRGSRIEGGGGEDRGGRVREGGGARIKDRGGLLW